MSEMNFELARFNMIEQQIRPWDVLDPKVLDVIAKTPRERFVPEEYQHLAFADLEIPLPHGQCMMAPKIEARMLQALDVQPSDVVLEVGTGSGYATACLAKLGAHVYSVDIIDEFKYAALKRLAELGLHNASLRCGDAAKGWSQLPRYDAIAVTGSLPEYHTGFEQSLALGGRLFVIVGEAPVMEAMLVKRVGENAFSRTTLFETELPALIGLSKKPEFVF